MKNILKSLFILTSMLISDNILSEVQKNGLTIIDKNGNPVIIHRKINPICQKILNVDSLFTGKYVGEEVLDVCKKSFVTQIGTLQPMHLSKKIKTVGELELLSHIKNSQEDSNAYVLIDARTKRWFKQMTIPTAVNLPFNEIDYEENREEDDFEDEDSYTEYQEQYEKMFKLLNIKETKNGLDFSKAKSLLLFCNGSWCSQSPQAIYKLINIGYPEKKLLWYRGGLQDWLIYDFPVQKGIGVKEVC